MLIWVLKILVPVWFVIMVIFLIRTRKKMLAQMRKNAENSSMEEQRG